MILKDKNGNITYVGDEGVMMESGKTLRQAVEDGDIGGKVNNRNKYFEDANISPSNKDYRIIYETCTATTSANSYIVNALALENGEIIIARANGQINRVGLDGTETNLLTISGAKMDWRLLWSDSNENIYVSPHATGGKVDPNTQRGLYRMAAGESTFTKVISLYDPDSSDTYEQLGGTPTIWTMCEDSLGYLYAGVYAPVTPWSARIYRSTDGGVTWIDLFEFITICPTGHHVHSIVYNQYNNALYAIVGEVNTIFKSIDHGVSWTNLNVKCECDKGSAMMAVSDGIIIGSDSAYNMIMSKLYSDDKTIRTCGKIYANTTFAIRRSDVTGWIYAFGKIDYSVKTLNNMPPPEAIDDADILASWKAGTYGTMTAPPTNLDDWQTYHDGLEELYPDDCIRPQHYAILVSKDEGESWEIAQSFPVAQDAATSSGIWAIGHFRNGECLAGRFHNIYYVQPPIVLTEGKHPYGSSGLDLSGDNLYRLYNL